MKSCEIENASKLGKTLELENLNPEKFNPLAFEFSPQQK